LVWELGTGSGANSVTFRNIKVAGGVVSTVPYIRSYVGTFTFLMENSLFDGSDLSVIASLGATGNITAKSNTFQNGGSGLNITGSSGGSDIKIQDNTFTNMLGGAIYSQQLEGPTQMLISGNTITGTAGIGIYATVFSPAGGARSITIQDNSIQGVSTGIVVTTNSSGSNGADTVTIANNRIGIVTPVQQNGILVILGGYGQVYISLTSTVNITNNLVASTGFYVGIVMAVVGQEATSSVSVDAHLTGNTVTAGIIGVYSSGPGVTRACYDLNAANNPANKNSAAGGYRVSAKYNAGAGNMIIGGMPTGVQADAAVKSFLEARNTGTVFINPGESPPLGTMSGGTCA
jgi:hypothetical protein